MAGEFLVQFWSADLTGPQLVGSFHFDESAESFCDEQNERLALSGIPSHVAYYFVIYP